LASQANKQGPGVLTDAKALHAASMIPLNHTEGRKVYALIASKALLGEVPPSEDRWPPAGEEPHQLRHCTLMGWPSFNVLLKSAEHCLV
jgi:hypothetical protein